MFLAKRRVFAFDLLPALLLRDEPGGRVSENGDIKQKGTHNAAKAQAPRFLQTYSRTGERVRGLDGCTISSAQGSCWRVLLFIRRPSQDAMIQVRPHTHQANFSWST